MNLQRTSMKQIRSAAINGARMSSGFGNRAETGDFYSVLSALLQNIPVNLLFALARTTLITQQHSRRRDEVKFIFSGWSVALTEIKKRCRA
jgi:hypothetical protein